ncbi:hypothetical protein A0H81_12701 [Grifola frondosa]|uniref:C2H2-type domain-containing protein n=1 Tax=Grifola frondosa TaxID=5627 RepID=A0A1C7LRP1_GRIFR|nr:hypothetical protein A0H81_12701 [Grifola frondosa]
MAAHRCTPSLLPRDNDFADLVSDHICGHPPSQRVIRQSKRQRKAKTRSQTTKTPSSRPILFVMTPECPSLAPIVPIPSHLQEPVDVGITDMSQHESMDLVDVQWPPGIPRSMVFAFRIKWRPTLPFQVYDGARMVLEETLELPFRSTGPEPMFEYTFRANGTSTPVSSSKILHHSCDDFTMTQEKGALHTPAPISVAAENVSSTRLRCQAPDENRAPMNVACEAGSQLPEENVELRRSASQNPLSPYNWKERDCSHTYAFDVLNATRDMQPQIESIYDSREHGHNNHVVVGPRLIVSPRTTHESMDGSARTTLAKLLNAHHVPDPAALQTKLSALHSLHSIPLPPLPHLRRASFEGEIEVLNVADREQESPEAFRRRRQDTPLGAPCPPRMGFHPGQFQPAFTTHGHAYMQPTYIPEFKCSRWSALRYPHRGHHVPMYPPTSLPSPHPDYAPGYNAMYAPAMPPMPPSILATAPMPYFPTPTPIPANMPSTWSALFEVLKQENDIVHKPHKLRYKHGGQVHVKDGNSLNGLPLQCPLCPRTFRFSNGLAIHLKWHWGASSLEWRRGVSKTCKVVERARKEAELRAAHVVQNAQSQSASTMNVVEAVSDPARIAPATSIVLRRDPPASTSGYPFVMPYYTIGYSTLFYWVSL